jgi:GH24 family phage-related lysozyme (muramidase)
MLSSLQPMLGGWGDSLGLAGVRAPHSVATARPTRDFPTGPDHGPAVLVAIRSWPARHAPLGGVPGGTAAVSAGPWPPGGLSSSRGGMPAAVHAPQRLKDRRGISAVLRGGEPAVNYEIIVRDGTVREIPLIAYRMGIRHSQAKAEAWLRADLTKFGRDVDRLTAGAPTTPEQRAALVSFAFNLGPGNLASSTLLKRHRAGDTAGAADAFLMWVLPKNPTTGRKELLPGLVRRRRAERALYLGREWRNAA